MAAAYAEVTAALEPLLALARQTGTHVWVTHHNVKGDRLDPNDAILGSTAIFGNVDTAIVLKKTDRYRTIQSTQRYGTDWQEAVLVFNEVREVSRWAARSQRPR
jgi:hypothetical protein